MLAALLGAFPLPAAAQQGGGKATEPGQIQKRIRPPEAPRGPDQEITLPKPAPRPAVEEPARKFVLVGVEIAGSTVYQPVALSFAYENLLSREISLSDVEKILDRITQKYRGDGYILSRAIAPPQSIEVGILRIQVIEGFVERVEYTGAKPGGERLLRGFADRIKAARPLSLAALERYLLLMADAPGLRVTPALKALDEARGAYLLQIGLRHDPVDGFVNLDNRGTTPVGPLQAFAGVNLNSALGMLERTRLVAFTVPNAPEELRYGQIYHEQILNSEGTRAWFAVSRSTVDTGDSFGTRVTLGVSHPVIRSRETNLSVRLRFDALDSDKNEHAAAFDDRLRVVRLGGRLGFKDGIGGTSSINAEISKGLDVLHATDRNATLTSRTNGRADFVKLKLDVVRRQKLVENLSLQLTASGQKSPHTLLSSEEFSVGGRRFGRAYDPSEISGNEGAAGALELRFDSPYKPAPMRRIQIYGYYDFGAVWGAGFTRNSMASAGGGLRLGLPFDVNANVEFAWPLTRAITPDESDQRSPRVFFNILAKF